MVKRTSIPAPGGFPPHGGTLAAPLFPPGKLYFKDEKQRLEALCARIGIPSNTPEYMKWHLVGRRLASEQPEFKEKPGRGRRSVGKGGVDYRRAMLIKRIASRSNVTRV